MGVWDNIGITWDQSLWTRYDDKICYSRKILDSINHLIAERITCLVDRHNKLLIYIVTVHSYTVQNPVRWSLNAFYTSPPGRLVYSDTNLTCLRRIQPCNNHTQRLFTHVFNMRHRNVIRSTKCACKKQWPIRFDETTCDTHSKTQTKVPEMNKCTHDTRCIVGATVSMTGVDFALVIG